VLEDNGLWLRELSAGHLHEFVQDIVSTTLWAYMLAQLGTQLFLP